ncbi:pyridoxamine 5'-phosphate oxidase family protein [Campylobacter concisus]|uniref:Pyridoxamine 5'-phosphate oxidase-related, FMN-binding protein n=1 Tax=Campylobacter concisus TaxID=199 RepID=A0A0M3V201_9BACT|nr:pyridoxamine 5'-phosphate oxidase family protein [Campylobacter concisus]ALF46862.1 pyridoxamine 5'-phosphate oxidase-related, FMN-binding protein [Campylobacter concisus]
MRRKDRELSREDGLKIIDECEYAVISCVDDEGEIFSVPISPVRVGESIFIHGATAGCKAKLLQDGRKVEFVCVGFNKVPYLNDSELDAIKDDGKALGGKVFTTEYKSAIAKTRAYEVEDEAKRYEILKILSQKYTAYAMSTFDVAANYGLGIMKIYELKIESLSAKAKILPKPAN